MSVVICMKSMEINQLRDELAKKEQAIKALLVFVGMIIGFGLIDFFTEVSIYQLEGKPLDPIVYSMLIMPLIGIMFLSFVYFKYLRPND